MKHTLSDLEKQLADREALLKNCPACDLHRVSASITKTKRRIEYLKEELKKKTLVEEKKLAEQQAKKDKKTAQKGK